MKTDLTPGDLTKLTEAYEILTRLGQQTAMPSKDDMPYWYADVDQAHQRLALVILMFHTGRWEGTEPWTWKEGPLSRPILNPNKS